MKSTFEQVRAQPTFRGAFIAPIFILIIFGFFNLTSTVEPSDGAAKMTLAIVNSDEGFASPIGNLKISEQILKGAGASLPFGSASYESEEAARDALNRGTVSMVLLVPADFSANVVKGAPAELKVIRTDHLSIAEAQFGAQLPGLLQANFSMAASLVGKALAAGMPPSLGGPLPVTVSTEVLHAAPTMRALLAPFVLLFPTWLAALVGSLMLFIAARGSLNGDNYVGQTMLRLFVPVIPLGIATLCGVLVVGFFADTWGGFFGPWFYLWGVGVVAAWIIMALFSLFGFLGLIAAVPLVFYQAAAAGALAPAAAAPSWFSWLNDVLPLQEILFGLRSLLIGGPVDAIPYGAILFVAVVAAVLVFVGTAFWAWVSPKMV
jgi:hypothetical protein